MLWYPADQRAVEPSMMPGERQQRSSRCDGQRRARLHAGEHAAQHRVQGCGWRRRLQFEHDAPGVLAGQGGNFFVSRDGGRSFTNRRPAEIETSIADLIGMADGAVVTVGEAGAVRLNLP